MRLHLRGDPNSIMRPRYATFMVAQELGKKKSRDVGKININLADFSQNTIPEESSFELTCDNLEDDVPPPVLTVQMCCSLDSVCAGLTFD